MKTTLKLAAISAAALALTACQTTVGADADVNAAGMNAGTSVMVGGAAMYPNRTIVQNASAASNLTTLVAAVKAAGLVDTLSGPVHRVRADQCSL